MSHPAFRYTSRAYPKRSPWRTPKDKESKLRLVPRDPGEGWGEAIEAEPQRESQSEISEGYKAAIALLRSLRNVSAEEAQEQRETWELLERDLDEERYH